MFDIGWTEMMMLAVLAVIVIGPKDLPRVLRTIGHWMGKARGLAREFQSSLDDIAREAELDEIKKGIDQASAQIEQAASETEREIHDNLDDSIDPTGTDDAAFDLDDAAFDGSDDDDENERRATEQDGSAAPPEPAAADDEPDRGGGPGDDERYKTAAAPAHSLDPADARGGLVDAPAGRRAS